MISADNFKAIAELDLEPIKVKLMHEESGEGWSLEQVNAVEFEYRRFLYLMKMFPHEQTAPLFDVDTFWHYHILDTMKYAADCATVFGYFLHHFPYIGLRGEDDEAAHHRVGERMRELYEETFGESYIRAAAVTAYSGATSATAYSGATQATAYSGATAQQASAYSGATTQQATAYSGATTVQATAYSGATTQQATAYSGATTLQATAYSGATTMKATAYSGATTQKASAYSGATTLQATAYSGATSQRAAYSGATTAQATAYSGATSQKVAYSGVAQATPADAGPTVDAGSFYASRPRLTQAA